MFCNAHQKDTFGITAELLGTETRNPPRRKQLGRGQTRKMQEHLTGSAPHHRSHDMAAVARWSSSLENDAQPKS